MRRLPEVWLSLDTDAIGRLSENRPDFWVPIFITMVFMKPLNRLQPPFPPEPVRRVEAGPWAIELLPGSAYATRYVASQAAIGFAFDSQRGLHAIGSDRVQPFIAMPNGLAFVPAGCDVLSESPKGGEYLRVMRTDGMALPGDRAFNNRIDPQATALALRMRSALLQTSSDGRLGGLGTGIG